MIYVLAGTFQNLQLRRCWMSGDPSSVPLMSPCKEQSATLSSFYPPLCPQSCTTMASSKQILTLLPFQKQLEFYTVMLQMVVHVLHLSAELIHLQLICFFFLNYFLYLLCNSLVSHTFGISTSPVRVSSNGCESLRKLSEQVEGSRKYRDNPRLLLVLQGVFRDHLPSLQWGGNCISLQLLSCAVCRSSKMAYPCMLWLHQEREDTRRQASTEEVEGASRCSCSGTAIFKSRKMTPRKVLKGKKESTMVAWGPNIHCPSPASSSLISTSTY